MQNLDHVPKQRKGYHLEEIDGENMLYGRVAKKAHYLNDSASVVWKLCDGSRTVSEIIELLAEAYPQNPGLANDVHQALDRLVAEGALVVEDPKLQPN